MKWLATVLFFIASVGFGDIIPADRLVEWSTNTCGIPGGIPVRTNIYKTLWPGDDIQGALNLCPIGQVVLLTNGTFNLAGQLSITRPITLRGLTNTLIRGSSAANSGIVNMSVSHSLKGFETIASGATKGSTQLILSSGDSGLKPGYHIYVTQINPSSTAFICPDGGHGAPNDFTRNSTTHHTSQLVEVTNVSGANTVIDFLPPLVWSFSEGATKQINYYTGGTDGVDGRGTNMIVWAGVEDLSIQNTSTSGDSGQSIVWFNRTAYCWMKNVTTIDCCDSHVRVDSSYRFEIRGNTMTNVLAACNTSSHGYCVLVYYASSGGLIEDNIVVNNRDFIKMQGGSSGNAVLYNYQTNAIEITLDPNLRKWTTHTGFAHSAHPLMNLFEGNITYTPDFDFYWGSGSHETLLRNWFKGPNYWANREGAAIKIEKKYSTNNVVGNVLGSLAVKNNPVWTNQSSVVKPNTSWGTVGQYATFLIGYYDDTHIDGSYDSDAQWANTIAAGNYDFVTLSTAWYNPSTPDTITNSYFYGDAKPLYFGTNTWPPFSPSPLRYSETAIPAGYRFVNHSNPPLQVLTISPQGASNSYPNCVQYTATVDFGSGVTTNVSSSSTWTVTDYLLGIPNPAVSVTPNGLACISNSAQYRININAAWSNLTAVSTLTVTNTQPTPNTNPIVCNLQWWAPRIFGYSGCAPSGLPSVFTNYMLIFVTSPECTVAGDFEGSLFFSDNVPKTSHTFTFSTNSIDALIGLLPSPKRIHFDLQCTSTNGGVTTFPFGSIPLGCPTEINGAVLWNPGSCAEANSMTVMY